MAFLLDAVDWFVLFVHSNEWFIGAEFGAYAALLFFDFLRQLAKLFGLFVARLYLQLCELSRVLSCQDRHQGLEFRRYLACVIGLFQHQMFKFPDCLVVIHRPRFGLDSRCMFYFSDTSLSTNSE